MTDIQFKGWVFQTKDINLAAYLKIKGYKLKECVKQSGRVLFWFIDDDPVKREQDMYDFYNDIGSFQSYTNARKDLKSFLHNLWVDLSKD